MPEYWDLDYDEELLSHLHDPEAWVTLKGEEFNVALIYDEEIKTIYEWSREHLREHKTPPSASVLAEEFDLDLADPETAVGDLVERMRRRYMRNQGRQALEDITDKFKEDVLMVPGYGLKRLRDLQEILGRRGERFGTGDYDRSAKLYDDRRQHGRGPGFGFSNLDDFYWDMRGITFLIGSPKTFKSWFMVRTLIGNVSSGRFPWLYALELPAEETNERLYHMLSGVPWKRYIEGTLTKKDREEKEKNAAEFDEWGTYAISSPPQGERSIDSLVTRAQDSGVDLVLIDQLQYVEVEGKALGAWNETGKYWQVLDRAREYSKDIPILFAHQFNRHAANAEKMPHISQAKGSAAVEETLTLALGLWTSKEMRRSSLLEIGTLASRNSDLQNWECVFDFSTGCELDVTGVKEDEDE